MTNEQQNQSGQMAGNEQLISYCGIYCKECIRFTSGKCGGCRGSLTNGFKKCRVRPCSVKNGFFTCADCTKYASAKDCKRYNPLLLKIAAWVQSTSRIKAIEMIKEKGQAEFLAYMTDRQWVIIKTKDSFFNRKLGKKISEK